MCAVSTWQKGQVLGATTSSTLKECSIYAITTDSLTKLQQSSEEPFKHQHGMDVPTPGFTSEGITALSDR